MSDIAVIAEPESTSTAAERVAGSFRDPGSFVYTRDGVILRQINASQRSHYDRLMGSGLYDALVADGLLVPHREVDTALAATPGASAVIEPQRIDFISYPYEWCFSQLKDAALATLAIQKHALDRGMTLKDCSAYNVQFDGGRPTFIDTGSFEARVEGAPWAAYRQFCQHFLAPLALMSHRDVRLGQLLRVHLDGIPLDLATRLLGWHGGLSLGLGIHLRLHARMQTRYQDKPAAAKPARKMSLLALRGLVDSLERLIHRCRWNPPRTEWGDYYGETNYSHEAFAAKRAMVAEFLSTLAPKTVWDLGANDGTFSRIAAETGAAVVSMDADPVAVERNYRRARDGGETRLLPLLVDLTNPSAGIGWANRERASLAERGPVDAVMALALVHHLAISNNTPLTVLAEFFAGLGRSLIIEFVPKTDSQVQRLLASREDVFGDYDERSFERAFGKHFNILQRRCVGDSQRTCYLMTAR